MERVWIGLGSNLLNPRKQAEQAIWELSRLPKTMLVTYSSYYRSRPMGPQNQDDFLNMVIVLDTSLSPEVLLSYIQYIEQKQGRIRDSLSMWQSRTLDLDILLFGKYIICSSKLVVPHYDIFNREFVIYPLFEIDQHFIFPDGQNIKDVIKLIPKNDLVFWKN